MDEASNDDVGGIRGPLREPDPHGQAAMLMVESLIHSLVANCALSLEDAVQSVDIAAEVAAEMAGERDGSIEALRTLTLLSVVAESLRGDLPRNTPGSGQ